MTQVIYEPRSLWSIQRVVTVPPSAQTETHSSDLIRAQFVRNHFKNPSRYPITITRVAVAPINYTFREINIPNDIRGIWNAMSNLQITFLTIAAPQRQLYMGKPSGDGMRLATLLTDSRAEPLNFGTVIYPSGLFGISYLEFDKPLHMPKLGTMEFQPSNYTIPNIPAVAPVSQSRVSMLWHEVGGSFCGAGRQKQNAVLDGCTAQPVFNPDNPIPFAPDAFGVNVPAVPGPTSEPWPPNANFSARDISRQNLGLAGSNIFSGLSVHVDQINIDLSYQSGIVAGFGISPLNTRMGCRARTVDGGSGENWWTPGAPMCLVLDTITPATVYPLPKPIVVEPGDTLDATLYIPPHVAIGSPAQQPAFNIGISFNGYATIEG